ARNASPMARSSNGLPFGRVMRLRNGGWGSGRADNLAVPGEQCVVAENTGFALHDRQIIMLVVTI
ncbi:MAG: hypothetical protein ACRECY_05075, partial [Phyllobacterium sp.]